MRHPVWNLPQGTPQLRRQGRLLQLHCWLSHHCTECPGTVVSGFHSGYEEVGHCPRLPQFRWCHCRRLHHHRPLLGSKVWKEVHDGLPDCLQSDRRSQCRRDSGSGCGCCSSGIRFARWPVQGVVPIRSACLCCHYPAHRDHLSQRKYSL